MMPHHELIKIVFLTDLGKIHFDRKVLGYPLQIKRRLFKLCQTMERDDEDGKK
jgi:hypothetical protein